MCGMAKIAGKHYPSVLGPSEAEKWIKTLVNDFGGKAESQEAFAQEVGHKSSSSGTFMRKIADARKFGLMTPRGEYEATELGFDLANPEDESHRYECILEMCQNIPLLEDLHDTLDGSQPDELWRVLTEITGANPKEAREAQETVEELYSTMIRAEKKLETLSKDSEAEPSEEKSTTETKTNETKTTEPSESDIFVRVGKDEIRFEETNNVNLELAQHFLESKLEGNDSAAIQTELDEN